MSSSPQLPRTHFPDPDVRGMLIVVECSCESARPSYAAEVSLAHEWHRGLDMFNELVLERALASMLTEYATSTELIPADLSATASDYPLISYHKDTLHTRLHFL